MGVPVLVLDCSTAPDADIAQLDVLARLQLLLKRRRCDLRLANPRPDLVDLLAFAGLAGVLRVEPLGEAEEREQAGGVEEEREL